MEQPRRSGRITKKPERYEPIEQVTDDFDDDGEYSSDSDDSSSECDSVVTGSTTYISDSDGDEHGNLKGFVVDSDPEDESEPEPEPEPKPKKKRKSAVKDRDINIDI